MLVVISVHHSTATSMVVKYHPCIFSSWWYCNAVLFQNSSWCAPVTGHYNPGTMSEELDYRAFHIDSSIIIHVTCHYSPGTMSEELDYQAFHIDSSINIHVTCHYSPGTMSEELDYRAFHIDSSINIHEVRPSTSCLPHEGKKLTSVLSTTITCIS